MYPSITPENPGPPATPDELSPPSGAFLVAYLDDEPVGCGGIKRLSDEAAELKRLYVAPKARKLGVARTLVTALEDAAQRVGYRIVRLDTGDQQPAALQLFRTSGYREIDDYNGNTCNAMDGCGCSVPDRIFIGDIDAPTLPYSIAGGPLRTQEDWDLIVPAISGMELIEARPRAKSAAR